MYNPKIDITKVYLETERLILRPFLLSDLDDFYAYACVPGVGECAGWPHHENIETSRQILHLFITGKKTFAIVLKANNQVIGSIGIEKSHFPRSYFPKRSVRELGYVLSQDYWGQGLMSEAVKRVITYCFNDLHLDYLTIGHFKGNHRSQRVIEKMGFIYQYTGTYQTQMGTMIKENLCYLLVNPHLNK
ncbi:MAG: GNAT family N-acetyltransferase [Bacilli bacterium]